MISGVLSFPVYRHGMISPHAIELVQDSFADVVPITDTAAAEFYRRLFAAAPDTRALFHTDMAAQGRKLFLTLATVVDGLDRLDTILPVARELAIRHIRYGAKEQHYAAVGAALIETLRVGLGERFDVETEAAWSLAYRIIADAMIGAARRAA